MAELKTKATRASVDAFLKTVADERRVDCRELIKMMTQATRAQPRMWGSSIIGFGKHRYKYESGREGEWFITGFSPRKTNLTLYVMPGVDAFHEELGQLGPHKTGRACLYIKRLADIDIKVLRRILAASVRRTRTDSAAP